MKNIFHSPQTKLNNSIITAQIRGEEGSTDSYTDIIQRQCEPKRIVMS